MNHSSSSAVPSGNTLKRKFTRDQLLRNLQILGPLSAPLPPELPVSPPPSRAPSPSSGLKRKLPVDSDHEKPKRPRTSTRSIRSEPTEDGELRESSPAEQTGPSPTPSSSSIQEVVSTSLPVRRPRRGRGDTARYSEIKEKYHTYGKMLKYSGDARFWSTYPPNHRYHRPLANPPPVNSPYHKHGNLIARLELVDALVSFAYSMWSNEYFHNDCFTETWGNIEGFLGWCKAKWSSEDTKGEQEKAFLGLVYMIEAFVNCRKFMFACIDRPATAVRHVKKEGLESIANRLNADIERQQKAAADALAQAAAGGSKNGNPGSLSTPTMLPSPASASSANSTPTMANRSPVNTNPSANNSSVPPQSGSVPPSTPQSASHHPSPNSGLPAKYPLIVHPETVTAFRNQNAAIHAAKWCSHLAAQNLNIPILAKHFPMTWARIFGSSLLPDEEYEPDFEDEEGELYWPGQCQMGEGLGWLCLMGESMIKEFGKGIGYKGIEGVIKKEEVVRGREIGREMRNGAPPPPIGHHRPTPAPPHLHPGSRTGTPSHHTGGPHGGWTGIRPPEMVNGGHHR